MKNKIREDVLQTIISSISDINSLAETLKSKQFALVTKLRAFGIAMEGEDILPYPFDLYWDLQTLDNLNMVIKGGSYHDNADILKMISLAKELGYSIVLNKDI